MRHLKIRFTIILCSICLFGYAENKILGTIYDSKTNEHIGWADVMLLQDNQVVYNTISNDLGYYEITTIKAGRYTLKISYLGYQEYSIPVIIKENTLKTFNIQLKSNIESLDEVVVTGEKTTIEFKADKRIINVGKDLIAAGASTENILQQIPSVEVDISGNVSLRDDSNVIVMIDGKRSTLSSADVIAQVPANLIQKIEVITNPSAKYDAEGVSGIINIITKKRSSYGGNLGVETGIGEAIRHHTTVNGNYRAGKFNIYTNYNYRVPFFSSESNTNRETNEESIDQQTKFSFDNATVNYIKSGVDIFIDTTNTISFSGIYARNEHTLSNTTNTQILDQIANERNAILFKSHNTHIHVSKELNVNYRKELNGRSHYLETDVNYANYPNIFQLDQNERIEDHQQFVIDDLQKRDNTIVTFGTDYYWDNEKNDVLEAGIKAEFKNLDNTQNRIEQQGNTTTINDNFLYKDRVLAAYVVYNRKINNLQLKGGLRLEDYQIDLNSNDLREFNDKYINLFPSFSMSYTLDKNELSASYTRRISRPGIFSLNPFTMETGNLTRRRGNPFLRPSFADKIELNYNRKFEKFNINLSAFYSQVDDVIQFVLIQEGDFLVNTFDNIGNSKRYGAEVFSKMNWFSWWNTSFSLNYYFSDFATNQFNNSTTFSQRYRVQNEFKFAKTWSAQLNGNINPQRQGLQGVDKTNYRTDFAISKRFLENKGQAIVRINDVFNTAKFISENNLVNLYEKSTFKPQSRFIYLTLKYNLSFGKNTSNRSRKNRQYSSGNVD